jgi:protease-4
VGNGLADEVGTMENAMDKAAELAGISDYEVYDLALNNYDLSSLYSLLGNSGENGQRTLPLMKQ